VQRGGRAVGSFIILSFVLLHLELWLSNPCFDDVGCAGVNSCFLVSSGLRFQASARGVVEQESPDVERCDAS
jgi:hypothetical protein